MYTTVMTRGKLRRHEYSYFPSVTGDSWWRAYRVETSFEHPTLLLESGPGDWRLYAGGIPSDRHDSTGTPIRYSCILTGKSTSENDVNTAQSLISAWIRDADRKSLGCVLDRWATEDTVSAWFQSSGSAPNADDVVRAVADAIHQTVEGMTDSPSADTSDLRLQNSDDVAVGSSSPFPRVGGLVSPGGATELLAAATRLLRAEITGCALVLNLVNFSRQQQPSEALGALVSQRGGPHILILDTSSSEPVRDVRNWPVPTIEVMPDPKAPRPRRVPRTKVPILTKIRMISGRLYRALYRFSRRTFKILPEWLA